MLESELIKKIDDVLRQELLLLGWDYAETIDRLTAEGWVERVTCDDDRRGQWASLTDAGYARLREASPTHLRGVAEHFLNRLPDENLAALERALGHLED